MSENQPAPETASASEDHRISRFRRAYTSSFYGTGKSYYRSTDGSKFNAPPDNKKIWYGKMNVRLAKDADFIKPFDELDTTQKKYVPKMPVYISREPSFTKFKVPFQMVCKERYSNTFKKYEQQFAGEIQKIIDNQPTAREATYLVRIVAYTTLWPPYHNESELVDTSRHFYRLTPKEQTRFQYIMTHDY